MKKIQNTQSSQSGLTLIELLIAMVLGVTITGAGVKGFSDHLRTVAYVNEMVSMNERARYAQAILERAIRSAGTTSCPADAIARANTGGVGTSTNIVSNVVIGGAPAWYSRFHFAVEGQDNIGDFITNGAVTGDDSNFLIVHSVEPERTEHLKSHSALGAQITTIQNPHSFNNNEPLLLTGADCRQMALFTMSQGQGSNLAWHNGANNCMKDITGADVGCTGAAGVVYSYATGSELTPVNSKLFYVNSNEELAFVLAGANDAENVIVEGVDYLIFHFGIDTNNDGVADRFKLGADVMDAEWVQVSSVDVSMMLKSQVNILPDAGTKSCGGKTSDSDKLLRSCYSMRVNLRGRVSKSFNALAGEAP